MEQSQNTSTSADAVQSQVEHLAAFLSQYQNDAGLRSRLLSDPHGVLGERGFDIPKELEVRVVENTDELFHVAFPLDPNTTMSDEELTLVAGGNSASTVGTAGSVGTVVSTASSIATAGTTGSKGCTS